MMALQHFMKTFHLPPRLLRSWGQRSHSRDWAGRTSTVAAAATERQPVLAASAPLRQHRDLQDRARRLGARSGALKRRDPYCRFSDWASIKVAVFSVAGSRGKIHSVVLRRWLGLTPERPALHL